MISWFVLAAMQWRRTRGASDVLFPVVLGAFGLGGCLMASVGRVPAGLHALTASRFLIFGACFWSSWLLLIASRVDGASVVARRGASAIAAAMVIAMACSSYAAITFMREDFVRVHEARAQLLRGDVGTAAIVLYPDPHKLEHMRDVLARLRLSVFRRGIDGANGP